MSKKSILIVEDETALREAYEMILSSKGYKTTVAVNGKEGLKAINDNTYDLILLDLLMPEMDGLEVLKTSEVRKKSPGTKIVLFSNVSSFNKIEEAIDHGVDKHVLKSSLTPDQLTQMVDELTGTAAVR